MSNFRKLCDVSRRGPESRSSRMNLALKRKQNRAGENVCFGFISRLRHGFTVICFAPEQLRMLDLTCKAGESTSRRRSAGRPGTRRTPGTPWFAGRMAPDSPKRNSSRAASLNCAKKEILARHIYDRFRDRLIFPICNDIGEVIAFSGRILNSEAQGGKYVNSPETPLFSKGNLLFGLYQSKRFIANARQAIVLEGQLDLITTFEAGIQNVVAPQGTALTERHAASASSFCG